MDFKSVIEFVKTYNLDCVHDTKFRYSVGSLLHFYYGECWYIGLLQCHDEFFVYIRHEDRPTPEICFKWYKTRTCFTECIYGWFTDKNVIIHIMSEYKKLNFGDKYGLR